MLRITMSHGVLVAAMVTGSACRGGAPHAGSARDSTIGADRAATVEIDAPRWARLGRVCSPSAPASSLSTPQRDSLPPVPAENVGDENDRWVRVARTVPGGFGGYFVRGGGRETIYLTDPSKRREAIAALNVHHIMGTLIGPDAVAERARWDFVQLYEWYRYLSPRIHSLGVWEYGIDVLNNRIRLSVSSESARQQLEKRLVALGVPCLLVAIEVGPPPGT